MVNPLQLSYYLLCAYRGSISRIRVWLFKMLKTDWIRGELLFPIVVLWRRLLHIEFSIVVLGNRCHNLDAESLETTQFRKPWAL